MKDGLFDPFDYLIMTVYTAAGAMSIGLGLLMFAGNITWAGALLMSLGVLLIGLIVWFAISMVVLYRKYDKGYKKWPEERPLK